MTFSETTDDLTDKIDFVVCLGGDGTLLYASSLFQQSVPPIMAFHLGSLGFLTPFKFEDFQSQVGCSNYQFLIGPINLSSPVGDPRPGGPRRPHPPLPPAMYRDKEGAGTD